MAESKLGSKAFSVLKRHFTKLLDISPDGICDFLFSDDVITMEELERATNKQFTTKDRTRKLIMSLNKAAKRDHGHFERFCDFLIQEVSLGYSEIAETMKADYTSKIATEEDHSSKDSLNESDPTGPENMKLFREKLAFLQKMIYESDLNIELKHTLIKEAVEQFVQACLHTGTERPEIEQHLNVLCYQDVVIPRTLHEWCFKCLTSSSQQYQQQYSSFSKHPTTGSPAPPKMEAPSLFTKEIVYHSMFLCVTVDTCNDESNYKRSLFRLPTGHSFEQVSMSADKSLVERCIIAKKKKILFVAFRGEPSLCQWPQKYSNFREGIECQVNQMPVRFFAEQIREGCQIVLTGFSFGGLLAVSVMARIWKHSYIAAAELQKKVMCIGFGVPMLTIPDVAGTLTECPEFESTIHLVYLKEDTIPRLMMFMNLPLAATATTSSKHSSITDGGNHTQIFEIPFLMDCLISLQNISDTNSSQSEQSYSLEVAKRGASSYEDPEGQLSQTLDQLKRFLSTIIMTHKLNILPLHELPISGVFHLLFNDPNEGMIMQDLASHAAKVEFGYLTIQSLEQLNPYLFKQHAMGQYQQRLFRGYLDRSPSKYSPPLPSRHPLEQVKILKPSVSKVEFHRHGNNIAVILEGDNLWFCHQVDLGSGKNARTIKNPSPDITRCSIMFDYAPQSDHDNLVDSREKSMQVTLHSHFTKPLRDQSVEIVCKEDYEMSLRQSQLARHPPSELIELAFLSAMLEYLPSTSKSSSSAVPSKRYKLITNFLEDAVRIVPIESICHAIGTSDDDRVALKCARALVDIKEQIIPSMALHRGLELAFTRIALQFDPSLATITLQSILGAVPPNFFPHAQGFGLMVNVPIPHPFTESMPPSTSKPKRMSYSAVAAGAASLESPQLREELGTQQPSRSELGKLGLHPTSQLEMDRLRIKQASHPQGIDQGFDEHNPRQYRSLVESLHSILINCEELCLQKYHAGTLTVIGGSNIEELYPLEQKKERSLSLSSPLRLLRDTRKKLMRLSKEAHTRLSSDTSSETESDDSLSCLENTRMLEIVNDIWLNELSMCASLLGAFMEQQIEVPLVFNKSPLEMAQALYANEAPAAVGVWVLFSLGMLDTQKMLKTAQGNTLLVQITDYVRSFCSDKNDLPPSADGGMYAGKLQFLLQCLQNRVSCNTQYISYSLERQLASLCDKHRIDPSTRVGDLVKNWKTTFKDNVLTLVEPIYRPLLARWVIWSMAVHRLREGLASYTTVGVIGLVNSGKSKLVESLFKRKVLTGTLELERTTVPFMFNLDDVVEGLSVIDFPGVDDRDKSIPGLAKLLLTLAQLVVLVVDYRKIHSESAKTWLDILHNESVPYLVCLSHADKLYANHMMSKVTDCTKSEAYRRINMELQHVQDRLGQSPNRSMKFYSFCQDQDSKLNSDEGRNSLKAAGIYSPKDVGDWIESKLRSYLKLDDIASKLRQFLESN